jgi:hypothetical protein
VSEILPVPAKLPELDIAPFAEIAPLVCVSVALDPMVSAPVIVYAFPQLTDAEAGIVNPENDNVPLFVIVAPLIVTVPAVGAKVVDPFTVKGPAIEKLVPGCVDGVPAIVKALNVNVPEFETPQPVPVIVIVPAVGANVVEPFTVSVPATKKLSVGCVDGVPAIVNPLNVNVPPLVIVQAVPVNVTVPAVGAKVVDPFIVKGPATEKFAVGCVEGVPAIVKP